VTVYLQCIFLSTTTRAHVRVATPDDPATSRIGEIFYSFLVSISSSWLSKCMGLERERLPKKIPLVFKKPDDPIQSCLCFLWLLFLISSVLINTLFGRFPCFWAQSFFGFSLLELANYLEALRMGGRMESGTYERVSSIHSWNASQVVRIFYSFISMPKRIWSFTRNAHKRYQVLNH